MPEPNPTDEIYKPSFQLGVKYGQSIGRYQGFLAGIVLCIASYGVNYLHQNNINPFDKIEQTWNQVFQSPTHQQPFTQSELPDKFKDRELRLK